MFTFIMFVDSWWKFCCFKWVWISWKTDPSLVDWQVVQCVQPAGRPEVPVPYGWCSGQGNHLHLHWPGDQGRSFPGVPQQRSLLRNRKWPWDSLRATSFCQQNILRLSSMWNVSTWEFSLFWQVANLFARDEMDEIMGELIPIMKKEFPRRPPSNENLYDYYLTRVRNNLHVVLCFSPVSIVTKHKKVLLN